MEKNKRMSLKEAVRLNLRAIKIWNKLVPGIIPALTLSTVISAVSPYVPLVITARLLEEIAGACDTNRLLLLAILLLGAVALTMLAASVCKRWYEALSDSVLYAEAKLFFSKLLTMDFCVVDDTKTHELYSQIRQNANWSGWGLPRIEDEFKKLLGGLTKIVCSAALSVSLFIHKVPNGSALVWMNGPGISAALISALAAAALLSPYLFNKGRSYWVRVGEDVKFGNRMFSFLNFVAYEDRDRAQDIRVYAQDRFFHDNAVSFIPSLVTEKCRMAAYARGPAGLYQAASELITRMLNGIIYLFVCLKALGGAFGVGYVTQYIGAVTSFSGGVSDCVQMLGDMRNNAPYLKLVMEFLDIQNVMYQGSLTTEKRNDREYDIEFQDVSFRYPGSEAYALSHISMKFKIGERLAVVGENGSGKTTFIKLLCRLYDPTEGVILLNGIDIRKYRYEDYLSVFSVVFQDFHLLALPLGQNVASKEEYNAARAEACLQKVGFGERIASLPNGLDSYLYKELDKDGVEISGGEAQKIAIARALYKDASFIILDEPTAALDPIAEAEIYEKFNDIAGDKTTIYISHRLSSCKFCDEIIVFDKGKVVQQGTHEGLLANEIGKYHELWYAQAQYYTKDKQNSEQSAALA